MQTLGCSQQFDGVFFPTVKDKEDKEVDSEARPMKDETFGEYRWVIGANVNCFEEGMLEIYQH